MIFRMAWAEGGKNKKRQMVSGETVWVSVKCVSVEFVCVAVECVSVEIV